MILAIDQGTTGTTCLVVDSELHVLGQGYQAIEQHFPAPGWVEHDPEEIWQSVLTASEQALATAGVRAAELRAIGIANQRETTLLWDRRSGSPVQRAIVWQDRRTAERCNELPADRIRATTGLIPDPYFSATKLEWLLQSTHGLPPARDLAFGTVDTWLAWRLTGGRAHVTDASNASRTMLVRLSTLDWDDELLRMFGVPREILPEIRASSELVGEAQLLGATVPIAAIAGDQQAALFGQACHTAGQAKATYGTGGFLLIHTGEQLERDAGPLLATAACRLPGRPAEYALEGSIFIAGAALQWLRDELHVLAQVEESDAIARSLGDNGGVYFVPALVGLGTPHWAPKARGLISGLTRGSGRAHVVRAALEAIGYQTRDVVEAGNVALQALRVDGGVAANGFAMQFLADILGTPVELSAEREATALGAAGLAGLAIGIFRDQAELAAHWSCGGRYEPGIERVKADHLYAGWQAAVAGTLGIG